MNGECSECGRLCHTVTPDGWYFLCNLHNVTVVSVERVPEGILSERQLQVSLWVAEGYTNSEIAQELGLSSGYVRNVVSQVIQRLRVDNRRKVVRVMRRWDLP